MRIVIAARGYEGGPHPPAFDHCSSFMRGPFGLTGSVMPAEPIIYNGFRWVNEAYAADQPVRSRAARQARTERRANG